MLKIIADSSCDIKEMSNEYKNVLFSTVPLNITINDKTYIDNENLDIISMMNIMESTKGKSTTACPSPELWINESKNADEIFLVPMTNALSGSYNSAMVAKNMILENYPCKKVYVVNTLNTSSGNTLIIEKIASLANENLSFEKICKKIEEYINSIKLTFVLFNINNLIKSGRVNKLAGIAMSALNITLVGEASKEGTLTPLHKVRGQKKSIDLIVQEMIKNGFNKGKVIITHCFNEEGAIKLKEKILNTFGNCKITIQKASGLVSYYAERSGILVGYEIG